MLSDVVQFEGLQGAFMQLDRYWQAHDPFAMGDWIALSRLTPIDPRYADDDAVLFFVPDNTGYSDYSGSLVHKANAQSILEENCGCVHGTYGAYGSAGIAIVCRPITDCANPDMHKEILDSLRATEDYPLIDEDLHSALEMEAIEENWENWAEGDFRHELEAALSHEGLDDVDLGSLDLREMFEEAREAANVYWINESGDSMHVDIRRVVESMDTEALADSFEEPEKGIKTFRRLEREARQAKELSARKQAAWDNVVSQLPDIDPEDRVKFLASAFDALQTIEEEEAELKA